MTPQPVEPFVVQTPDGPVAAIDTDIEYPPKISAAEAAFMAEVRSLPAPPVAEVNLDVPFIHQLWDTPDWFNGHWACGAASCAMVIAYYGLLEPKPIKVKVPFEHESEYGWYISNSFEHNGKTLNATARTKDGNAPGIYGIVLDNVPGIGWCAVWHNRARRKGIKVLMDTFLTPVDNKVELVKPSEEAAKESLKAGHPVIVSGRIFGWHHLLVIRGYYYDPRTNLHGWIVNDPYGYRTDGSYDGGNVVYLWREIKPKYMYLFSGPHTKHKERVD